RTFTVTDGPWSIDLLIDAPLAGTLDGIIKAGAGTMVLAKPVTYSGETRVNQGLLTVGGSSVLSPTSPLIVNGGIVDLAATTQTVPTLSLLGGSVIGTTGSLAVWPSFGFIVSNGSITARLVDGAGATGLVKQGTGTVTLSANNTYTGTTT